MATPVGNVEELMAGGGARPRVFDAVPASSPNGFVA